VDFESSSCAEAAVKALQSKGIQAQMAKVGITLQRRPGSVRSLHASKPSLSSYCTVLFLSRFTRI